MSNFGWPQWAILLCIATGAFNSANHIGKVLRGGQKLVGYALIIASYIGYALILSAGGFW